MKRNIITICALALAVVAQAQTTSNDSLELRIRELENRMGVQQQQLDQLEEERILSKVWKRRKNVSFFWVSQKLDDMDNGVRYKSDLGVGLQKSIKNFYFHHKPIAGMVKIGFDIGLDMNFARYKDETEMKDVQVGGSLAEGAAMGVIGLSGKTMMQADAGLAIGPSVHVAPLTSLGGTWRYLKVSPYFHMQPSFSGIILDGDISTAFNLYKTFGFAISHKALSLGCEWRSGKAKYEQFELDMEDDDSGYMPGSDDDEPVKIQYKTQATRLYLRFNF